MFDVVFKKRNLNFAHQDNCFHFADILFHGSLLGDCISPRL